MKAIFKFIKIVLAVLLILLIIALVGLFIFVKTFDANKYKPQIIAAAAQALGRQTDIKDISLSLSLGEGLGLQLKNLTIGDDPAFGKDNFFNLPQINAAVDVMTFIKERRIAVSSIVLNAPKVIVIRDSTGKLNVQTIGGKPVAMPSASAQPTAAASALAMPPLIVKSFKITDATIIFKDNTFNPPLECAIEHVNMEVKDFSLDKPFDATLAVALFADKANIQASSKVALNLTKQEVKLSDTRSTVDLGLFSMAKLAALPMVKKEQLPETLSGKIEISVAPLTASAKGLSSLSAQIKLVNGAVKTAQLAQAVSSINATLNMTDKDLTIDNFSAALAKGTISVKGAVKDYPAAKNIELELAVKDLELNDALEQSKAQIKIAGVVNFNFKAQGSLSDLKSIKGDGTLEIKPATLKDLNILKSVLDKITFIPGLSDMLINSLGNDKYSQELKSPDTQINRVGLTIKVEQGAANIDPLTIEADMFNFNGKAVAGFDQSYDVDGNITIAQDLSAQMAKGVKEMSYLFDDKNCIAIPVDVKGKGSEKPEIKVSETTTKLLKNAAINKGAEMLGNMLNKYVGGSGDSSGDSNSSGTGDAVKGLLNKFLSK
jgi:hypothetical protein